MTTSTARLALIVASVQRARAGSQRAGGPAQSAGARLRAASRSAWADWVYVPTGSMNPTILGGDRLLFDRHLYGVRVPFSATHVADGADPARGQLGCISCWATNGITAPARASSVSFHGATSSDAQLGSCYH